MGNSSNMKMFQAKLGFIQNHPGAGAGAVSVLAKANKNGVFTDVGEYVRFIDFFHRLLVSGDREKYPLSSNELYALEQINIWLMMGQCKN